MNPVVKVVEACLISVLSGSLISGLMIAHITLAERIQRWSGAAGSFRNWIRRILLVCLTAVILVVQFYVLMTWFGMIAARLPHISKQSIVQLTLLLAFVLAFAAPFVLLRKRVFRDIKVKKLWE